MLYSDWMMVKLYLNCFIFGLISRLTFNATGPLALGEIKNVVTLWSPITADENHSLSLLEQCITHLHKWLLSNNLLLNDKKTEFLICGTPQQVSKLHTRNIKVVNAHNYSCGLCYRNLGVWFDTHLTFERHISDVCKNSFYNLFNIRHTFENIWLGKVLKRSSMHLSQVD